MILVTGGAGFIGSNFVLDWLARRRRAGRQPRQADLRRQPRQPRARRAATRATCSCTATSAIAQRIGALLARAPAARDRATSPPRATSTARSTGPAAFVADQRRRHLRAARGGARAAGPRCRADERAAFRFLHVSTDEVYGSLGAGRSRVHRDHAVRAQQPVLGVEGGVRPPGARLPPHLRPADAHHQLLEQLRAATSFPRS